MTADDHDIEGRVAARTEGSRVQVSVTGDIDLANASEIEARIEAAIPNEATAVDVDLTDVTYLDSAGLRILFRLVVRLERLQIDLCIQAPAGSAARHAIDMSGMPAIARVDPPARD